MLTSIWQLPFKVIDLIIFILLSVVATIVCTLLSIFRDKKSYTKDEVVFIARFQDTLERHLEINSTENLESFFNHSWIGRTIVFCPGDGKTGAKKMVNNVIGVNIKVPKLATTRKYFPKTVHVLRDTIALYVSVKFISRRKPIAIEVVSPSVTLWRSIMLRWLLPSKLVAQVRGNLDLIYAAECPAWGHPFQHFKNIVALGSYKLISQIFYRTCDVVLGYNVNNMENAISNGAHPDKTYLTRIHIDKKMFKVPILSREEIKNFPPEGRVILLWCRINKEMRLDEAFQTILPALEILKDLHFVIIGDGPEKPRFEEWAAKSPVYERVHFLGFQSREIIRSAAEHSNIGFIPFGGSTLIESAFMELPIIAFDIEWHREVVRHLETGYLVDYRNVERVVEQIVYALRNPDISKKYAMEAKKIVEEMFDEERVNSDIHQIMTKFFKMHV